MTYKTHIAFATVVAAPFPLYLYAHQELTLGELQLFLASCAIGALLPDIDHSRSFISQKIPIIPQLLSFYTKHRGFTHSLYGLLTVLFILVFVIHTFHLSTVSAGGLFVGYLLHIAGDAMTLSGVSFCCKQKLYLLPSFLRFKTGSFKERIFFYFFLLIFGAELFFVLFPQKSEALLHMIFQLPYL